MPIRRKLFLYLLIAVVLVYNFSFSPALAYVMSSTNYRVEFDSVNTGGALGTSTNYKIEDTVGEITSGMGTSTSYNLHAGFQQMDQNTTLSLTIPNSTSLTPNIGGLTGGVADTQADILVSTNDANGYSLYINTNSSTAMSSPSSTFENFTIIGGIPAFSWQIPNTSSAFGFSPEGSDLVTRYLDNGVTCNQVGGSDTADRCWDYLPDSLTNISRSTAANAPAFTTTTVLFRAESGSQHVQESGSYSATIIITAHLN